MVTLRAPVEADELRAFVKERVAAYKYPRHVSFADELPMSPTGKILKRTIGLPRRDLPTHPKEMRFRAPSSGTDPAPGLVTGRTP